MRPEALANFCKLFYDANRIPVCCCDAQGGILFHFPQEISPNAFGKITEETAASGQIVSFTTDAQFLHWGSIRDRASGSYLCIGPVSTVPLPEQGIRAFLKEHIISGNFYTPMEGCFHRTPTLTVQQFLYILRFLHYQVNQEILSDAQLLNYLIPEDRKADFYSKSRFYETARSKAELVHSFDDAYRIEQRLLYAIETGRVQELRTHALSPNLPLPDVGVTPMSQIKTSCVVIITVISRFVIRRGLDVNTALRLSDIYLKGIESVANTQELTMLVTNAYADYSERLQALKIPMSTSPLIHNCIQYVRQMVNTPLSASDVARYVGKSLSYLSTKFKAETGVTLSTYITQSKIEEAKSLLRNTNMTIGEISSYLCFSDQSYFQRQFRTHAGITPMQYREKANL